VGGKAADRFSANLSGDPRRHAGVAYGSVGGSEIGHALFDGRLKSAYGSTLRGQGEMQEAWSNSLTGTLMGASEDYESNWFKQIIASGLGFVSGYKIIKYFYPEHAAKIWLYGASAASFMIGITNAQTAAWTMFLGTGLAGAAWFAPVATEAIDKHVIPRINEDWAKGGEIEVSVSSSNDDEEEEKGDDDKKQEKPKKKKKKTKKVPCSKLHEIVHNHSGTVGDLGGKIKDVNVGGNYFGSILTGFGGGDDDDDDEKKGSGDDDDDDDDRRRLASS